MQAVGSGPARLVFCQHHPVEDLRRPAQRHPHARHLAVGETVILRHPPLPVLSVSIGMERERQQNDRTFADGYRHRGPTARNRLRRCGDGRAHCQLRARAALPAVAAANPAPETFVQHRMVLLDLVGDADTVMVQIQQVIYAGMMAMGAFDDTSDRSASKSFMWALWI